MRAIVLAADGLNLSFLGCYGNEWVATPVLDRLAANGIVFDQHYADQPDAAGARWAWQTGCYCFPLPGKEPDAGRASLPDALSLLRGHGVHPVLITASREPLPDRLASGWERIEQVGPAHASGPPQEPLLRAVAEFLDEYARLDSWLLRVDAVTLLPPWHVPDAFLRLYPEAEPEPELLEPVAAAPDELAWRRGQGLGDGTRLRAQNDFAAVVTYFDSSLGLLLDELDRHGLTEEVLFLLTAGYGQLLDEPGLELPHRAGLHEERIHVPLIVRLPGKARAGTRLAALTQAVDLLPTLFEVFGLPPPPVHGQSLLPLLTSKGAPIRPYACSGLRGGGAIAYALRTPEWGFRLPVQAPAPEPLGEPELYVKPDDRWEVNDVRPHHLELSERLAAVLRAFVEATRTAGPLRPPELPALESEAVETTPGRRPTPPRQETAP